MGFQKPASFLLRKVYVACEQVHDKYREINAVTTGGGQRKGHYILVVKLVLFRVE